MQNTNFLRLLLASAALASASIFAPHAGADTGDIFETNENNVLRFRNYGATPNTFSTGFSSPKGIVFDGRGRVYVADAGRGTIVVFNLPDGAGAIFASGLGSPIGLTLDVLGNLYEADAATGKIHKFAADGTKTVFASGLGAPAGMGFDSLGNLFVADFNAGTILKFAPDGTKTTFATGLKFPAGIAIDSANNVFEADSGSSAIFKFAPDGTKSTFTNDVNTPYGLAFDATGNLIVADNKAGATLAFTPAGVKTVIFQSNFNTPQFVAVEPALHQLLNVSTRGLVQADPNVLIAGFVIGGNGPIGTRVIIRALGPSLTPFGITNALPNPTLELRDAFGNLIASNNDWKDSQETVIAASNLAPTDPKESAISITLRGGSYTAIVRGAGGTTGTAVVEVYNLQ